METSGAQLKDGEKDILLGEAKRIINLLKNEFLLDDGSLCLEKTGDVKRPFHVFHDLGDFIPFFLYFGEEEFIDGQIDLFRKFLPEGIFISEHPSLGLTGLAKSYEYTDLLFGLLNYFEYKQSETSRALLLENSQKAIDIFRLNKNPSSFYLSKYKFHLPVFDSRDGMFIELFLENADLFGDEKFINIAKNIFNKLIDGGFYRKFGILPKMRAWLPWPANDILPAKYFGSGEIMKYNTNCLFAFLSLFQKTKDKKIFETMARMIKSIKERVIYEEGGVSDIFRPKGSPTKAFLTPSFALLDFLCDFYVEFGRKEDIDLAKKIAYFWIKEQGETGLFPSFSGGRESFIDSEVDMIVALEKLFEITGDQQIKQARQKCWFGALKHHAGNNFILSADIDSGRVLNFGQRTKFVSLFLKIIILELAKLENKTIYNDQKLFNLLKDR